MATVKLYNNVFENEYKEFSFDNSKTLLENIEENSNQNIYKETLVECYDSETGKTFYAPLEEGDCSVLITANGQSVTEDYQPKEHDVILVFFLPLSGDNSRSGSVGTGALLGIVVGAAIGIAFAAAVVLTGGAAAIGIAPAAAVLLGAGAGVVIGGTAGAIIGGQIWDKAHKSIDGNSSRTMKGGKEGKSSPDVRGAENQSLRGNNYPFVVGKHLVTPFIVGDPVTEYSGICGKDAYIRVLYCIGYGPLKLTDFKLGEFMLAYNRSHGSVTKRTMMSGLLKGYSTGGETPVEGDIDDYWKNNDISLELLQHRSDNVMNVVHSDIYPYAADVQDINANTFYIADKQLQDECQVVYKGTSFPNKFKTNGVFFSASCPKKVTINLDIPNGIYSTHTHSNDSSTETKYDDIPLWMCIQWRTYNVNNKPSDPMGGDYYDWNNVSIPFPYGNPDQGRTTTGRMFNTDYMEDDIDYHRGNDFGLNLHPGMSKQEAMIEFKKLYGEFAGKRLHNLGELWDSDLTEDDLISQIRIPITIELTKAQCKNLLADTCTTNSIEIRVLRVSPNYLNEIETDSERNGPYSYSDLIKVSSIITESFDKEELKYNDTLKDIRPQRDADFRKFTYVAIRARADESGYLVNQLGNLNCMAESFSPIWDMTAKKILPEGITKRSTYWGYYRNSGGTSTPCNRSSDSDVTEQIVSQGAYENARQSGLNWVEEKRGSNLTRLMRNIIFTTAETHNSKTAYYLPQAAEKYNDNKVSSGFLLACMGPQNGPVGMGMEDVNILSIADWAEGTEALTDGSTFDGTTTYRGHTYYKGDLVPVHYEANAYIYSGIKIEDILTKIAAAGRAVWVVDETGKIKVIMDKPADYTKGVISAQTCLQSSNQFSFENLPAGLYLSFSDENDGYEQNAIYCWDDGYSEKKYRGQVEPCSIDFVTNNYQIWSLGRYLLACRVAQKEVLTRKIGVEGAIYEVGDVLLVQDDELLIGDTSGRVQELIEENGTIYGFVTDVTYEYKAEAGTGGASTQGVTAMQAGYMGKSNAVTLPIAMPSSRTIHYTVEVTRDGQTTTETATKTFTLAKGVTNVVLFANPVSRSTSEDPSTTTNVKYNFKTGDICLFGLVDRISAPYRIIKIKPEKDGTFTETLIPYNESIYNYGAQLPAFQKFITPPAVEKYPASLSDVPTTLKEMNVSRSDMYGKVDALVNGTAVVGEPDDITLINAVAHKDRITVDWSSLRNNGLKNTLKYYVLEYIKSGDDWTNANVVYPIENTYTYTFDRSSSADGYPEVADISGWKFRVKAVNVYNKESVNWKTTTSLVTQNYGTWIPATPNFKNKIPDRDGITISWYGPASSVQGKSLYGSFRYELKVYYNGTLRKTIDTLEETARYDFDRTVDFYPEATASGTTPGLDLYTFDLRVYNEAPNGTATRSNATISSAEKANYGTWIPANPNFTTKLPDETGISFAWNTATSSISGKKLYGNFRYELKVNYNGTTRKMFNLLELSARYDFDRDVDLYPEVTASGTTPGLNLYTFDLKVYNETDQGIATRSNVSLTTTDMLGYGTWIPAIPSFVDKIPTETGINLSWNAPVSSTSGRQLYGTNRYELKVYYDGTLRQTIASSEFRAIYNFVRGTDGYPERNATANYPGLNLYTFDLKVSNEAAQSAVTLSNVSLSQAEINLYGTWIPFIDSTFFTSKNAEMDGIDFEWRMATGNGKELYGGVTYTVDLKYNGTSRASVNTDALRLFYIFNRNTDKYPELHDNVETGDTDLSLYTVEITAASTVVNGRSTTSQASAITTNGYKTWKIPTISIQSEVVDRTAILTAIYTSDNIYGTPMLLARIKRRGNFDVINGQTFNQYLGITEDSQYYTPNFEDSPQPSTEADTEPNYRKNTSTQFRSQSNKITHTLPLIGQTPRLFNASNQYINLFSYQATEVIRITETSTAPVSAVTGDMIHYTGQTGSGFTADKWYIYDGTSWTEVVADDVIHYTGTSITGFNENKYYQFAVSWNELISKTVFVPTIYKYELQLTNESGNVSNIVEREITALCTSISDLVHSHEHYKDLYVEKLSAISANIGMISQGGMGSFADLMNYWALSDLSADDSGVAGGVRKGAFRVGGRNEYFMVEPIEGSDEYKITLKAGNITLSSTGDGTTFKQGTYIYDSNDENKRLALTPTGIIAQQKINGLWENIAKVVIDSKGNLILANTEVGAKLGFQIEGADIYHFETNTLDEDNTNPQSLTFNGNLRNIDDSMNPIFQADQSTKCYEGTVTKDISSYNNKVVVVSKAEGIICGDKLIRHAGTSEYTKAYDYNDYMQQNREGTSTKIGLYLGLSTTQINNRIFSDS